MNDSIISVERTKVMAQRRKQNRKILYGRIDIRKKNLAMFIGKKVKIIVCIEEENLRGRDA